MFMTSRQYDQLRELFIIVCDMAPEERERYLELGHWDSSLCDEVRSLLEAERDRLDIEAIYRSSYESWLQTLWEDDLSHLA
jgi:hypothetical protein